MGKLEEVINQQKCKGVLQFFKCIIYDFAYLIGGNINFLHI